MSKQCTVPNGETIAEGDAVCVIGFDTANNRPTVKMATRDNLATSRTVFGVAEENAAGGSVFVLVAGEVAENAITSLGAGRSNIVATDIHNATAANQCRLKRIDRPNDSEFVVGTCDEHGNLVVQPRASRDRSARHVYNVCSYGAVPDYDPTKTAWTDNLPFFQAALAAMAADDANKSAILVADGHFYLSNTLVLTQTVLLEGTGMQEPTVYGPVRSSPGTWLVFPKDVTGIRIHSSDVQDNPLAGADKTTLRNLTISCHKKMEEMGTLTSHGVHATATFYAENVTIENFGGDGFHVTGYPEKGNADGTVLRNCDVGDCGHDGFHFESGSGGDAQAGVIDGCNASGNGHAGFYDATYGNTYIGCHSAYNKGPNYITEYESNASVFINCWSEEGGPQRNEFHGAVTIISGKIGGNLQYMTEDSSAFILEHGVATRAPLVYKNFGVKNDVRATPIGCSLGNMSQTIQAPGLDMVAFEWAMLKSAEDQNIDDSMWLRYLAAPYVATADYRYGWWALEHNDSLYRHMIRLPTAYANARLPAPWFPNGIFIGRDDGPPKASFIAAPKPPDLQNDGVTPRTYEKGDVVWNSEPSAGGPIGWVCIKSGTQRTVNPATLVTFGSVRGTVIVDVTVLPLPPLDVSYETTIKLIGNLATDTTITAPSEDGWSARFLDLTTRNGFALKVTTSPGMADYALTNGKTQRLYIEYDASVPAYNIRPEGPPA